MIEFALSDVGGSILQCLREFAMNGDSYITKDACFRLCKQQYDYLSFETFAENLRSLATYRWIHMEGQRIYDPNTWRYEETVATTLANLLPNNHLEHDGEIPEVLQNGEILLSQQQREAVVMACQHRLSMILGGAGTGKSTLIHCLAQQFSNPNSTVFCAPTGKAARNITLRTGQRAYTIHSTLGRIIEEDFLSDVVWEMVELLVVDEASMITLEMLAGVFSVVSPTCAVVLVGDPNQLLSIGCGNVMEDLKALGIPHTILSAHHRQADVTSALAYNVHHFDQCKTIEDLHFDDSFVFHQMEEQDAQTSICQAGSAAYSAGENVQVLSPFNRISKVSVGTLNRMMQKQVNDHPPVPYSTFRHMDRVMITKNDWFHGVLNGDVGTLAVDENRYIYSFYPLKGNPVTWCGYPGQQKNMDLAYAITVHKSQGSSYDTVMIPLCKRSQLLTRNWIYTAFSRGKKKVIFYGNPDILNQALQSPPKPRASMLVVKTRQKMASFRKIDQEEVALWTKPSQAMWNLASNTTA